MSPMLRIFFKKHKNGVYIQYELGISTKSETWDMKRVVLEWES